MNEKNTTSRASDLKSQVLSHIEEKSITPAPRYTFLLHESLFWSLFVLSLFIGAAATAGIIFAETHVGWEFYEVTHENALTFAVETLPVVWILMLCGMVALGYFNLRETKRGYRYSLWTIMLGGVAISIVGGFFLHQVGVGYVVDHTIGKYVPLHRPALMRQVEFWHAPEEGRLVGLVASTASSSVSVIDPEGNEWKLDTRTLPSWQISQLTGGTKVRLLGFATSSDSVFFVCASLPAIEEKLLSPLHLMESRRLFMHDMEDLEDLGERNMFGLRSKECEGVRTRMELAH